jgi:hypothetical protein
MAETLGSLCDKLVVVVLKHWHSQDPEQVRNILFQEKLLQEEINEYIQSAVEGLIPFEQLSLPSNKVYKKEGDWVHKLYDNIGEIFSALILANCKLWHVQEKAYEFEKVPIEEKDTLINQQSILNLERNQCIDEINAKLSV